eukprot:5980442-Amphidinium_carterae.1
MPCHKAYCLASELRLSLLLRDPCKVKRKALHATLAELVDDPWGSSHGVTEDAFRKATQQPTHTCTNNYSFARHI